jgi:hypothetical protein
MIHPEDRESVFRTAEEAVLAEFDPTLNIGLFAPGGVAHRAQSGRRYVFGGRLSSFGGDRSNVSDGRLYEWHRFGHFH